MLTAALSFLGIGSDVIKWRPLLRSLQKNSVCVGETLASLMHTLLFSYLLLKVLFAWLVTESLACANVAARSDLTRTEPCLRMQSRTKTKTTDLNQCQGAGQHLAAN